jgi:putative endonuclease
MSKISKKIGWNGEELATDFLKKQGYRIIARNFQLKVAEVDIIAEDAGTLVFLEVKNYRADSLVEPLELITPQKRRRLMQAAQIYLATVAKASRNVRFDLVVLRHDVRGQVSSLELFKNIF